MSKVVFVGNVPYNMAEEELIDVFKSVGQVVGFRLVFDRETGKPRGYGFCEFADHETATSAVRNLNNVDVGGRPLRIDLADSDPFLEGKTTVRGELLDGDNRPHPHWRDRERDEHRGKRGGGGGGGGGGNGGGQDAFLGQLPKGVPVPPGSTVLDMISTTLATMQPAQLVEVLAQMKAFVITHPDQARALLVAHPQFAYALFQALLLNKIVDQSVLQRMLQATTAGAPPTGPSGPPAGPGASPYGGPPGGMNRPPPPQAPPMSPYGQPPPMHSGPPPPGMGGPPLPGMGGPPPPQTHPPNMYAQSPPTMPPPSYGGYRPPPPSGPQGPPQGMPAFPPTAQAQPLPAAATLPTGPGGPMNIANMGMDPAQKQMLMQVLSLTPEQVGALQPSERDAIQALRNQFMGGISS